MTSHSQWLCLAVKLYEDWILYTFVLFFWSVSDGCKIYKLNESNLANNSFKKKHIFLIINNQTNISEIFEFSTPVNEDFFEKQQQKLGTNLIGIKKQGPKIILLTLNIKFL